MTLVEAVVSLTLAALIFAAVGIGLVQALKASAFSRQSQQAIDVVSEKIEALRALDFAAITMNASDATFSSDTGGMRQVGGVWQANVDGKGTWEQIVTGVGGAVPTHTATVTRNKTAFQVKTYVTRPPDDAAAAADSYRRVTVLARWTTSGLTHTRLDSTFVTVTRRGLPLPIYTWTQQGITNPVTYIAGSTQPLLLEADLTNKGARDRWSLSATAISISGSPLPWTFVWYLDDGNGTYGPEDARADDNADGTFDTGLINTDGVRRVWAVAYLSPGETLTPSCTAAAPNSCDKVALRAVSTSSPTDTNDQKPDIVNTVNVSNPVCIPATPACAYKFLYLHNLGGTAADGPATTAASGNPMSAAVPVATVLRNYDSDLDSQAGRSISVGGSGYTENSLTTSVLWTYTTANAATFAGTADLDISAVLHNLRATDTGAISAYLRLETTAGTYVNAGSATFTSAPWNSAVFRELVMGITVPTTDVCRGCHIELRLEVPSTSAAAMDIAYDTTSYASVLALPYTTTSVVP